MQHCCYELLRVATSLTLKLDHRFFRQVLVSENDRRALKVSGPWAKQIPSSSGSRKPPINLQLTSIYHQFTINYDSFTSII